jgi:hypothetical protein
VISSNTVLRRLKEHNLTSHPPATGPKLNADHRKQRLEFAEHMPTGVWTNGAGFSLRMSRVFTRYSLYRHQRVFRDGECYAQCCFASKVPFGGGDVMI